VPIAPDTELTEFNGWTLRVRKATHLAPRFLLLLHGWTGDENSMWVFARDLPSHYWMVAPRAPHVTQPGGFSWRPLQESDWGRPRFEQLRPAAEALIRLMDEYQASAGFETSPERRQRIDVLGFSQGAAMSSVLAMLYPERIRKIGILAGFVPSGMEHIVAQRPLAGKPVFVAHGTRDEMVPIDRARASIEILEQAGAQVTYCEDEVGHKVSLTCLQALRKFLAG
jgi:phospholipase/carboxylesterase